MPTARFTIRSLMVTIAVLGLVLAIGEFSVVLAVLFAVIALAAYAITLVYTPSNRFDHAVLTLIVVGSVVCVTAYVLLFGFLGMPIWN